MKFTVSASFSDPDHLIPLARAADRSGWTAMSLSDHVVHPERLGTPYPYT